MASTKNLVEFQRTVSNKIFVKNWALLRSQLRANINRSCHFLGALLENPELRGLDQDRAKLSISELHLMAVLIFDDYLDPPLKNIRKHEAEESAPKENGE